MAKVLEIKRQYDDCFFTSVRCYEQTITGIREYYNSTYTCYISNDDTDRLHQTLIEQYGGPISLFIYDDTLGIEIKEENNLETYKPLPKHTF